jgi:D-3-phosphoglycerate dehydrogenase
MAIKVLVCDTIDQDGIKLLEEAGFEVDQKTDISSEELLNAAPNYDALIVRSRTKVKKPVFETAPNLKAIARAGVGLDNIDDEEAKKNNVIVFNSAEASGNAVAELVIGMVLGLARHIPKANSTLKKGEWSKSKLMGIELSGKTLGLIGFGNTGYLIALKAHLLGMNILAYSPSIKQRLRIAPVKCAKPASLEKVLRESDFLSLNVPVTKETRRMMNKKAFSKMKQGAYIVNASRGEVIDEEALKEALDSGKLAGAALDVFEKEPPEDLSLITMENVLCTPHIGAATLEAQKANSIIVAKKLIKFFK